MAQKEYYSIDEVAEILSVSVKSVRRLVASGELEAIRVSNLYRISQSAFDQFVSQNTAKAKEPSKTVNYNLFGEALDNVSDTYRHLRECQRFAQHAQWPCGKEDY